MVRRGSSVRVRQRASSPERDRCPVAGGRSRRARGVLLPQGSGVVRVLEVVDDALQKAGLVHPRLRLATMLLGVVQTSSLLSLDATPRVGPVRASVTAATPHILARIRPVQPRWTRRQTKLLGPVRIGLPLHRVSSASVLLNERLA